ncbi:MAG: SpoIIE family protein phosphatase [Candidatus Abawacabacteria bacterium]|nr:SpoIIE family protein phosphatase [Candidatus Abawacabacteria bacterium]
MIGLGLLELLVLAFVLEPTNLLYLYISLLIILGNSCFVWLFSCFRPKQSKTSQLAKASISEERLVNSLLVAEKIQKYLLPAHVGTITGLDVYAKSRPSEEIGGDFYQVIPISPTRTLFAIGDVAGHGLPSAMISIIVDTLIHAFAKEQDMQKMTKQINTILYQRIAPNLFSTLLLLLWDSETKLMSIVSAGFGRFLHYHSADRIINTIKGGGIALGMVKSDKSIATTRQLVFTSGDVLILSTDGILEMQNGLGKRLGIERWAKIAQQHAALDSAEAIFQALSRDILSFAGTAKQIDDVTLMVIRHIC